MRFFVRFCILPGLLIFLMHCPKPVQGGNLYKEIIVSSETSDTLQVASYLARANHYRRINFDSMYFFSSIALQLSETVRYKRGQAASSLLMGISQLRRGDLEDAMELCQRALKISVEIKDSEIEAEALNHVGLNYNYQGNYPVAMEYYLKALSLAGGLNNSSLTAGILTNVGGIYYNLKDYNRALDYWKQSLSIYQQLPDSLLAATSMSNIGLAYTDKGDYQMALQFFFESLRTLDANALCPRIYPLENIGTTYYKMRHLDSAAFYFSQALKGAEECNNPVVQIGILTGLADVSKQTNNLRDATGYLERAFAIGNTAGLKRETSIVARSLSDLYEQLGRTDQAYAIFKTYHALWDSIYNSENAKALGRMEARYEYDSAKKEQEIARRIENLEKEKLLAREKWVRNTFIGGFVIMLFVAAMFYRNFQRKKISSLRLELLNREINAQQAALILQAEQLSQLNESLRELNTDLERKVADRTRQLIDKNTELQNKNLKLAEYAFINAHKLRAPVATILGLVKLYSIDPDERDEIMDKIGRSSEELNEIVKEIRITLEAERPKTV